jgi:N-acetyltransferase 10
VTAETLHPSSGLFGGEGKGASKKASSSSSSSSSSGTDSGGGDLQGEEIKPKASLPPLLTPIAERPAELLHWFGASFGLTSPLLTFWSRKGFKVCYLRQTRNDLTGEHSAIVLRELDPITTSSGSGSGKKNMAQNIMDQGPAAGWLAAFVKDYRRRLIALMNYSFNSLEAPLAITLLDPDRMLTSAAGSAGANSASAAAAMDDGDDDAPAGASSKSNSKKSSSSSSSSSSTSSSSSSSSSDPLLREAVFRPITAVELLSVHLSHHDLQRLELYSRNMVDHHMILDTLPILTTLLFQGRLPDIKLSYLQVAIVLAIGLQHRDVDSIGAELDLPANQVLAFFNKTVRKITAFLRSLIENEAALALPSHEKVQRIEMNMQDMSALRVTLDQDQRADELDFNAKQQQRSMIMGHKDLAKHSISAEGSELEKALAVGMKKQLAVPKVLSVPKVVKEGESSGGKNNGKNNGKQQQQAKDTKPVVAATAAVVLPAYNEEEGEEDAQEEQQEERDAKDSSSAKSAKKDKKDKKRMLNHGGEEEATSAPAPSSPPATASQGQAMTEHKKHKSNKKSKRESI